MAAPGTRPRVRAGAAAASEPHVAQEARRALSQGNAVDAVVTGVLAAAAVHPGVLLGPFQLLAAGAGAGLCAVDGRVRQPGSGVPRPRGVVAGEAVPEQARVGVPVLPAAVALTVASLGSLPLWKLAERAVESARAASPERAQVIEAFARRGAVVLGQDSIAAELIAVAGRASRGGLTGKDLSSVRPAVRSLGEASLDPPGFLTLPWRASGPADGTFTQVVAAADARGLVAIGCYEAAPAGVAVPSLGLVAPALASPVLRGQPRLRPGQPLPACAPIAIRVVRGLAELAFGVALAGEADECADAVVRALVSGARLAQALAQAPAGHPVAVERG